VSVLPCYGPFWGVWDQNWDQADVTALPAPRLRRRRSACARPTLFYRGTFLPEDALGFERCRSPRPPKTGSDESPKGLLDVPSSPFSFNPEPFALHRVMRATGTRMSNDIGSRMTTGDHYRLKAAVLHARAIGQTSARIKEQFEKLSRAYLRLAEQADRNACVDLLYEPPPLKLSDGP